MKVLALLLAIIFYFPTAKASERFGNLSAFRSDGCSDFPNGTSHQPNLWLHCCVNHDLKYWAGGTASDRLNADRELRACVAATGHAKIGELMFTGVRVGGCPFLPTPFRWGYGWQYMTGYTHLNEEELLEVQALTPRQNYGTVSESPGRSD